MEITRHFTSTVLIVHRSRVLLHLHKKFGSLLPVGGHVERDELPEEAALREVKEETGLSVQLYNPDPTLFPDVRLLVRPVHMLLIPINPYHQHIDFIYYATTETEQIDPQFEESNQLHWYTHEEILAAPMPENVRILALEALALLGKPSS